MGSPDPLDLDAIRVWLNQLSWGDATGLWCGTTGRLVRDCTCLPVEPA